MSQRYQTNPVVGDDDSSVSDSKRADTSLIPGTLLGQYGASRGGDRAATSAEAAAAGARGSNRPLASRDGAGNVLASRGSGERDADLTSVGPASDSDSEQEEKQEQELAGAAGQATGDSTMAAVMSAAQARAGASVTPVLSVPSARLLGSVDNIGGTMGKRGPPLKAVASTSSAVTVSPSHTHASILSKPASSGSMSPAGGKLRGAALMRKAARKIIAVQNFTNARTRFEAMVKDKKKAPHLSKFKKVARNVQMVNRMKNQTRKAVRQDYNNKYGAAGATMQHGKLVRQWQSRQVLPDTASPAVSAVAAAARDPISSLASHAGQAAAAQAVEEQQEGPARRRCCHRRGDKIMYYMEELFSTSHGKAIGLIVFAALQVLIGACFLTVAQGTMFGWGTIHFFQAVWESWTYIADPGTHADEEDAFRRVMSFIITVGGLLFFAVVVGFVVDAIRARMEALKRGRSSVVESGHYLLLGWTDLSFALIRELCLAMQSEGGGKIVILAELDKSEVESEIREHFSVKEFLGTSIVCRTGSSLLVSDLNKVAASTARAIVILADVGEADKADAKVLRTVLSLLGLKEKVQGHVVAELRDIDNQGLVEIVGKGMVETVVSHDLVGRLMIKCARQPGLADAFEMFLGFEGDEFYLGQWEQFEGIMFGDLYAYFPDAIPVGIRTADGVVVLNPSETSRVRAGDQIMFLAEDDDMFQPQFPPAAVRDSAPPKYDKPIPKPERLLMCGWRRDLDDIVDLLDTLVPPGSELHMLCEIPAAEREERFATGGLEISMLENLKLVHHVGSASSRKVLEQLPLDTYSSVLILTNERTETDSMHSDSTVLASVLLIRHIQDQRRGVVLEAAKKVEQASQVARSYSRHGELASMTRVTRKSRRTIASSASSLASRASDDTDDDSHSGISLPTAYMPPPTLSEHSATAAEQKEERSSKDRANWPKRRRSSTAGLRTITGVTKEDYTTNTDVSPNKWQSRMCTELLDIRTRTVVKDNVHIAAMSDFILSTNIVSRVLAMVAERREVKQLLDELLGPAGQEVKVKPADHVVAEGENLSFWEVSLRCRKYEEILLGYKPAGRESLISNPAFKDVRRRWSSKDSVVVMCDSNIEPRAQNNFVAGGDFAAAAQFATKEREAVRAARRSGAGAGSGAGVS